MSNNWRFDGSYSSIYIVVWKMEAFLITLDTQSTPLCLLTFTPPFGDAKLAPLLQKIGKSISTFYDLTALRGALLQESKSNLRWCCYSPKYDELREESFWLCRTSAPLREKHSVAYFCIIMDVNCTFGKILFCVGESRCWKLFYHQASKLHSMTFFFIFYIWHHHFTTLVPLSLLFSMHFNKE